MMRLKQWREDNKNVKWFGKKKEEEEENFHFIIETWKWWHWYVCEEFFCVISYGNLLNEILSSVGKACFFNLVKEKKF